MSNKLKVDFGLNWENKVENCVEECKENRYFLVEDKLKLVGIDDSRLCNILIEGENYHALSILSITHKGKIDIIYIDPPYNNGKKDWKYNNNYVDKEDGYRHSKWLSFMNRRLLLAKELLTEKGVLICTIDRHETARLALLLEQIFPGKKIVKVTIEHNPRGVQGDNFSHTNEDAYFVYPSGGKYIGRRKRETHEEDASPLRNWGGESDRRDGKKCFYPIFYSKNDEFLGVGDVPDDDFHPKDSCIEHDDGSLEFWPIDNNRNEKKWRYSKKSILEIIDSLVINNVNNKKQIQIVKTEDRYKTVWYGKQYDASTHGTRLLNNIIDVKFPYPKSLYAVEECIEAAIHDKDNSIILDFFGGSGTTAHAIIELNKKDGGNRQFIICTNNENDICEDVTYPRIRNIIEGRVSSSQKESSNLKDDNFEMILFDEMPIEKQVSIQGVQPKDESLCRLRYFKIDSIKAEKITEDVKIDFSSKSIDILRLKENCFDEVSSERQCKIFKNEDDKYLGIICDDDYDSIRFLVEEIKRINKKFVVYLFSYDEVVNDEGFEGILDLVDLNAYPSFMLNTYRRIHNCFN